MRNSEMQDRIERIVYSTIDDIAEELEVEVKKYPEVNWIGRKDNLEALGLSKCNMNYLRFLKKLKSSCIFGRNPIIFIVENNYLDIAEESAHYVHFLASKIKWGHRQIHERNSLRIISEAFAFLGTKFVIPERKNFFSKYEDMFYMDESDKQKTLIKIANEENPSRVAEYFIYQQGYGLGERMFYDFLSGGTSKKELHDFITTNFGRGYDPNVAFVEFKLRYWPPIGGKLDFMRTLCKKNKIIS